MRSRGRSCFLRSISRRAGKADQVRPMCSVDRIDCVIDRRVHDRKAPRRMDRGWLGPRRPDDHKKCSIPLQNWVDCTRGGAFWMLDTNSVLCSAQVLIGRFSFPARPNSAGAEVERLLGGQTLTAKLFSLHFMQQFTQTHVRPVQLRLRNTYRVPEHLCDLMMFI